MGSKTQPDRQKLTKTFIDSIREPGLYHDSEIPGFMIRVGSTCKTYQLKGKVRGEQRPVSVTIGRHGNPWTPSKAREEAQRIRLLMRQGINPNRELKARREMDEQRRALQESEDKKQELTLRSVFEDWCSESRKTKESTKGLYRDVLFKHLSDWLDKPLQDITESMVSKRYYEIADVTVSSANNAFRATRMLFNWARRQYRDSEDRPLVSNNPVSVLSERRQWENVEARTDYIPDEDLPVWYQEVSRLNNKAITDYFCLLLVTGLRRAEAANLRWTDIDFKRKSFTARDTKNRRDLTLPLTEYTSDIFQRRWKEKGKSEFVFPGPGKTGRIVDVRHYERMISASSGVQFTPHALRRTFAYAAARQRLGESERKALLNHLEKGNVTDAHYTPWHIDHLREPLQLVEDFLLAKAGAAQMEGTVGESSSPGSSRLS